MHRERVILRIGPLAARYGVSPQALRDWERDGLIPRAHRTPGGHRRYGVEHLEALNRILPPIEPLAVRASGPSERVPAGVR